MAGLMPAWKKLRKHASDISQELHQMQVGLHTPCCRLSWLDPSTF